MTDLATRAINTAQPRSSPPWSPPSPPEPRSVSQPIGVTAPGGYDELRLLAESFEDVQRIRVGIGNRLGALSIEAGAITDGLAALEASEKKLGLAMRKSFRRAAPAVRAWTVDTFGIGEHLMARLIGVIGSPVLAEPHHWEGEGSDRVLIADPPYLRTVSQLWSYCGHGDPTRKRRKGMTPDQAFALGNPRAKMLAHLIALHALMATAPATPEGAMKCTGPATVLAQPKRASPAGASIPNDGGAVGDSQPKLEAPRRRSPYVVTYDACRARYEGEEQWASDAHRHNSALRVTAKEILRDLWVVAHEDVTM